jgi:adenylate cyclase
MPVQPRSEAHDEAFWHDFLTRGDGMERRARAVLRRIPADARCKLCAAPFAGPGAPVMRALGKRPSGQNPSMCASCFDFMVRHHGGAEIECTLLFADVRGSTTMAEGMSPADFRARLDRFYAIAAAVVFAHDGSIDKFVGDEVMAMFFPLLSGPRHTAKAIEAATSLLQAVADVPPGDEILPIGAGIQTGSAWVGAVGEGAQTDLTAVGDVVNTAARLASSAEAGEVLVALDAASRAALDPSLPRRSMTLKGKAEPVDVVTIRVA